MFMLLAFHISVAIGGLVASTLAFLMPSKAIINSTYGLIFLTLISGTSLVVSTHVSILHACASGLVYVSLTSAGALAGQRKMAAESARNK